MDLEHAILNYLSRRKNPGKSEREIPYLAVIHRLDQPVEGILVFARTPKAAADLNRQLTGDKIEKKYQAVVDVARGAGIPDGWQELTDYLYKDGKSNVSKVVAKETAGAKRALLFYRVLEENKKTERARLLITLKTGRHHQIRVQMSHAGLPLCGDQKYNTDVRPGESLALCAAELSFVHPETGEKMHFETLPQNKLFEEF